jgi:hypothetical protein
VFNPLTGWHCKFCPNAEGRDIAQTSYSSSTNQGKPATCAELKSIGGCNHATYGSAIQAECPRTCRICTPTRAPTGILLTAFRQIPGVYIGSRTDGPTTTTQPRPFEEISAEACASFCLKDPGCKAFDAGVGSRLGACYLSAVNSTDAGAVLNDVPHSELHYYELILWTQCGVGQYSTTGRDSNSMGAVLDVLMDATQCTACPVDTYSVDAASTSCTACPSGTHTAAEGSFAPNQCVGATCPAGSVPNPANAAECLCPTDDICIADAAGANADADTDDDVRAVDSSSCRVNSAGSAVFNAGCASCVCTAPDATAQIDSISSPRTNEEWSIGTNQTIKYSARFVARRVCARVCSRMSFVFDAWCSGRRQHACDLMACL